jgi:lysophospholipase L1-like esterase
VRARLLVVVAALVATAAGVGHAGAAPAAGPLRIWPLGDSITIGLSAPQSAPGGYRTALDQLLDQSGTDHRFVGTWAANSSPTLDLHDQAHHDGHSGYRVDQVRRDLDGVAHAPSDVGGRWLTRAGANVALAPDVVLVHLGTNDILQRWDTRRYPTRDRHADLTSDPQRTLFIADLTSRLADLVLRIRVLRPHATIVIATIVPIGIPGFAQAATDYAVSVRQLVGTLRGRGLPVRLADAYAAFVAGAPPGGRVAPGLLCQDEVHPSAAGYAVLARTFASVLEGRTLPVPVSTGERP